MLGLHCRGCEAHPYVTAYEIAVKQGFRGSEEDWVRTLQAVYLARVTGNNLASWQCSDTYADLVEKSAYSELHLITLEGRTAFCAKISDNQIVFQTLPFESSGSKVYEEYTLTYMDVGLVATVDAASPGVDSITKAMLSSEVRNSLDGAVQVGNQADRSVNQTHAVGVDANGKLWVECPTDLIKESMQPVKGSGMACEVGIDDGGKLWSEGYKKPGTGIPETDLAADLRTKINKGAVKTLAFTVLNGTYTYYGSDFAFESLDDIMLQASNGLNVRIAIITTNDVYPLAHMQGAESLARMYFAGPKVVSGGESVSMEVFELRVENNTLTLENTLSRSI